VQRRPRELPTGLTERELEVLLVLVRMLRGSRQRGHVTFTYLAFAATTTATAR